MSTTGNKQVIWASIILMIWGVIMAILLASGALLGSSNEISTIAYVWGYAACAFTIICGILAFKFKNDRKKTLLLNIPGLLTAALFIVFMLTSFEEVASLIGAFLCLIYMGGVNRNARYLKNQEAENK